MAKFTTRKQRTLKQPEGAVRASQIVTTYGPGALVDLVHDAVMIKEMSQWRYGKPDERPSHLILEQRLEQSLRHRLSWYRPHPGTGFYKPPVSDDDPSPSLGVTSVRFPQKFVCTNPECRMILGVRALEKKNANHQFLHDCSIGSHKPVCVPVRFVAACENGHMQEFPWFYFVHQGDHVCDRRFPNLSLQEGPTGDFSDAKVKCNQCGITRRLSEARSDKGGMNIPCLGKRPWLGNAPNDEEACDKKLHLVIRTASNTWFSAVESALSIPEAKSRLEQKIEEFEGAFGSEVETGFAPIVKKWQHGVPFADYSIDEVEAAIAQYVESKANRNSDTEIREAEHRTFMKVTSDEPLMDIADGTPIHEAKFIARLHTESADLPGGVSRIVKVEKLREVRVLIGFSRLSAPGRSLQGQVDQKGTRIIPAHQEGESLPAAEILGEGIFIELDRHRLDEW